MMRLENKQADAKSYLVEQLKQQHCLWSYDCDSIHDIPDDVLIELVPDVTDHA